MWNLFWCPIVEFIHISQSHYFSPKLLRSWLGHEWCVGGRIHPFCLQRSTWASGCKIANFYVSYQCHTTVWSYSQFSSCLLLHHRLISDVILHKDWSKECQILMWVCCFFFFFKLALLIDITLHYNDMFWNVQKKCFGNVPTNIQLRAVP